MNGAHLHLILNHFPIIGTFFALLLLAYGVIRNEGKITKAGLVFGIITALFAVATFITGDMAEHILEDMGADGAYIEFHEEAAGAAFAVAVFWGVVCLAGFIFAKMQEALLRKMGIAATVVGLVVMGLMVRAGNTGGEIRHTEIRKGASLDTENDVIKEDEGGRRNRGRGRGSDDEK